MNVAMTAAEIVAHLKRSTLPTVLVEGSTDAAFYRSLESALGTMKASILQCDGRSVLLSVFQCRSEYSDKSVCFVADMDMWVNSSVPPEYSDVIFTHGYSIENDIYSDSDIERLLSDESRANHKTMVTEIARWFAGEVVKYRAGRTDFAVKPPNLNLLIPLNAFSCCPNELSRLDFVEPDPNVHQEITANYKSKLRGKLLYAVLARFFMSPNRPIISKKELLRQSIELAQNGPLITRLLREISSRLGIPFNGQMDLGI